MLRTVLSDNMTPISEFTKKNEKFKLHQNFEIFRFFEKENE